MRDGEGEVSYGYRSSVFMGRCAGLYEWVRFGCWVSLSSSLYHLRSLIWGRAEFIVYTELVYSILWSDTLRNNDRYIPKWDPVIALSMGSISISRYDG
jgi:hypothetical protein